MKKLTKLLFSATLLASLLFYNSCKKDDPQAETDNKQPMLTVGPDIVGMTGVIYPMKVTASDADGDAIKLTWKLIESAVGSKPKISEISTTSSSFTADIAGKYKVEVTASDEKGKAASGTITLYIGGVLPNSIDNNTTYPDLFENEGYPEYYVLRNTQVTAGITLEPGVVIEYAADAGLWFNGNKAFLDARGYAAKNIIFRGVDKVKGSWKAIHISSNNLNNKLDFVQILHAGSSKISNQKAALVLQSNTNSQVSITNTLISQSGGYGLYVDGGEGNITAFANNNFSDNEAAPIRFGAENMYVLDKNSVYKNNGIQAIEIASGTNAYFTNPGTVSYSGLSFHLYSNLVLSTIVTFESGVTCLFNSGLRLSVVTYGTIIANGNSANPITFAGINQGLGSWYGMEIGSTSSGNLINYTKVDYGGNSSGRKANIYMHNPSKLILTNSTISNSQTWGVFKASGSTDLTQSNNTFTNNPSGNIGGN